MSSTGLEKFSIKQLPELQNQERKIADISWSPDGQYIAASTFESCIYIWDFPNRCLYKELGIRRMPSAGLQTQGEEGSNIRPTGWLPSFCLNTAWSPDGQVLAYVSRMNQILIYDTQVDLPPEEVGGPMSGMMRVAWGLHGRALLGATPESVWLFMLPGNFQTPPSKIADTGYIPYAFETDPQGRMLAISSHKGSVYVFDTFSNSGKPIELKGTDSATYGLGWCPVSGRLAGCLGDGTIAVWDVQRETRVVTLTGHQEPCLSVAFSSDGKLMASKSVDNTVSIWECNRWTRVGVIPEATEKAFGRIAFHPTEPFLATRGENDLGVRLWEISGKAGDSIGTAFEGVNLVCATPSRSVYSDVIPSVSDHPAWSASFSTAGVDAIRKLRELFFKRADAQKRPTCFISYARGNAKNENWIEDLALLLRHECYVEVLFDRWHNQPGSSITKFFDGLAESNSVIPIGTPEYLQKYNTQEADPIVDAEIRMINRILAKRKSERERVLPLLLEGEIETSFPNLFQDSVITDCRTQEDAAKGLLNLVARLHCIDFSDLRFIEIRRQLTV